MIKKKNLIIAGWSLFTQQYQKFSIITTCLVCIAIAWWKTNKMGNNVRALETYVIFLERRRSAILKIKFQ